ncbi:GNAT family N-acetyltransferase [Psychrobacter sp. I-STPA10]|uniref:GNAT family N-acetyltransferase n=1 Tax=Psychrobacter sp. I-STPA10 TaxID=2585769 RepID=UPI001E3C1A96|nr:GNAT family N-acetyltransferase [Psychrobacter sp. I-STPA10]
MSTSLMLSVTNSHTLLSDTNNAALLDAAYHDSNIQSIDKRRILHANENDCHTFSQKKSASQALQCLLIDGRDTCFILTETPPTVLSPKQAMMAIYESLFLYEAKPYQNTLSYLPSQYKIADKTAKDYLQAAKRLRAQCFAEGFGATFNQGIDHDEFDEECIHIVVTQADQIIATTRLLDSHRASRVGRFYSENEFDLSTLLPHYPYNVLEIGRTCIQQKYRGSKVLAQLWQGVAMMAQALSVNAFMGCCSIPIGAGDINTWLAQLHNVPKVQARPKYRLPPSVLQQPPKIPPLLRTYLKMGASVAEQACFDVSFHCADIFIWMPFEQIKPAYQHLLQ